MSNALKSNGQATLAAGHNKKDEARAERKTFDCIAIRLEKQIHLSNG
ncbi:hypothetical protein [Paraburkholderia dilworthii]|nr:hypothetical protein [Paraburkholderia dilworthii]